MEEEGYTWWINRFKKMADYFDAYTYRPHPWLFPYMGDSIACRAGFVGTLQPRIALLAEEINRAGILLIFENGGALYS